MPVGTYSLVFQALPGQIIEDMDYTYVLRLSLYLNNNPDFAILKQGDELMTNKVLRRDADQA